MFNLSQRLTSWAESGALLWRGKGRQSEIEGEKHLEDGKHAEAEACLAIALEEADRKRESGARRICLRLSLAQAQRAQGKLLEAEQNARAALEHAVLANDQTAQTPCLNMLGEVLLERGNFAAAEKTFEEIVKIDSSRRHQDPALTARVVRQLGISRYKNGHFEEAAADLERAVRLHEEVFGPEHLDTGNLLGELGAIYRADHKNPEAERCLSRALRIHEKQSGRQSPEVLQDLRELAESLTESGDATGAAGYCERMLKHREQLVGGDLSELSEMQLIIARRYVGWGNYARGHELLIQAIGTLKRTMGPSMALALEALATIHEHAGRPESASESLTQAAEIWESCGPERTPDLVSNANRRAALTEHSHPEEESDLSIWREG